MTPRTPHAHPHAHTAQQQNETREETAETTPTAPTLSPSSSPLLVAEPQGVADCTELITEPGKFPNLSKECVSEANEIVVRKIKGAHPERMAA